MHFPLPMEPIFFVSVSQCCQVFRPLFKYYIYKTKHVNMLKHIALDDIYRIEWF